MGYYSNVGIATTKETYESILENATMDTLHVLSMADEYFISKYQPETYNSELVEFVPDGPEKTIVVLIWYEIKMYTTDFEYITKHIKETEGCITWAGEERDDIGFEEYGDLAIPWYEYCEVHSSIDSDLPQKEKITSYAEFTKGIKKCN